MGKKPPAPRRMRPIRAVTLDEQILAAARAIGAKQMPPITTLSRLIDEALADYVVKHSPKREQRR